MDNLIEILNESEYKAAPISYYQRIVSSFKSSSIFYAFLIVIISFISSFINALYVFLFFFLLNLIEYGNWSKCYITFIKKTSDKLQISYYLKEDAKHIEDVNSSFAFEVKSVWYKIRGKTSFLEIKHNGTVIVKQFLIKNIDEKVLLKLTEQFNG